MPPTSEISTVGANAASASSEAWAISPELGDGRAEKERLLLVAPFAGDLVVQVRPREGEAQDLPADERERVALERAGEDEGAVGVELAGERAELGGSEPLPEGVGDRPLLPRHAVEPLGEVGVEELLGDGFLGGDEVGVDARLDGAFPEEPPAEGVERGDRRGLEVAAGLDGAGAPKGVGGDGGLVERFAKALLHLAGGLLGEGHRGDPREGDAVGEGELEDAVHERRRLARAGGGLDEDRGGGVLHRGVAVGLVGKHAHRISSRAKRGLPGSRPRSASRFRS